MFRPVLVVPVLAFSLLAGCGSIAEVLSEALQQTFPAHQPDRTGSIPDGGAPDADVKVGDDIANTAWRGFYSFLMVDPTPGYQLKQAMLQVRQTAVPGQPYVELGPMLIDRVELGLSLSSFDYGRIAEATVVGVPNDTLDYHAIDVTALIQNAIADGERMIDLRLRFATDKSADGNQDRAYFEPTALLVLEWERL